MTLLFCYTCIILWILIKDTCAVCTLPGNLQNSVWVDSDKGDTTFNTTHVIGLGIRIGTGPLSIDEWECFHNESGTYSNLILKAPVTFQFFNETYRPFLCLRLVAITNYSYYYYIHAPEQSNAFYERVNVLAESSVASITDPETDVCINVNVTVDTADSEYHVLVKKGNETAAIQTCPSAYFGTYSYNVTDISTGATTCGTGSEHWDVCADRQKMTFNYTLCTTAIAYSASGSVFCVASLTSGSYVLHTVYNEDTTVDNSNTYRFTCFMSRLNADGSLTASMTPKSCTKTQTPSTQPTSANGTVVGLNVALNPIVLCPITTTTTTTTSGPDSETSVGPIIGGTIGGIVLIALLILLLCLCLRFRLCTKICKRKDKKDAEVNKSNKEIKTYASNKVKIKEGDIKEHESYHTYDGKNGGLNSGVTMYSTSEEKHIHTERDDAAMKKELPCAIDKLGEMSIIDASINQSLEKYHDFLHQKDDLTTNDHRDTDTHSSNDTDSHSTACPIGESTNVQDEFKKTNEMANEVTTDSNVFDFNQMYSVTGDDDWDAIEITRISQSDGPQLCKEGKHLNSTENIFAEYDAAMVYHGDNNFDNEKLEIQLIKQPVSARTFEVVKSDDDTDTKTEYRQPCDHISPKSKDESSSDTKNMLPHKTVYRGNSFRSVLSLASIEWNFSYTSPYALTPEQKKIALRQKIQKQKTKRQQESRKRNEEDERARQNAIGFKKWVDRKREEKTQQKHKKGELLNS